ncbi:MgtC/SapB family protein [Herminiimonas arsenitoxidans]|uniref:MgtC/SapB family protein n=1 Tax=Herminiimonas arsenitoxidans TaxID=1809410 RepID=UPI0009712452|nr:MgtC/SapB family protein [Herminiimonas arsenitoxidans]
MSSFDHAFSVYWSGPILDASIHLCFTLLAALILGALVGYERFYHGHAAGMRTYGVVCMASAALVAVLGHPDVWFGARSTLIAAPDPTHVIQGIVTGIGFLGAGVIVHEQYSTHGLTTAASIWASSAIGILVGLELYPAAIGLSLLSSACMAYGSKFENLLPSQEGIAVVLEFNHDEVPDTDVLYQFAKSHGYVIAQQSLSVIQSDHKIEWRFIATMVSHTRGEAITQLTQQLKEIKNLTGFQLTHARN